MVIEHSSSVCLTDRTDRIFLQLCVTFCACLVFHEFRHNLYITLAKYLEEEGIEEGIAGLLFSSSFYTVFSSTKVVGYCMIFQTCFFIAPCLANLSDISFQ